MFCFLNVMQVLHTQKLEYSIVMVSGFYEYISREWKNSAVSA